MAGAGRRVFQPGEVLTASNVMSYLQDQAVMVFDDTASRDAALGTAVISEGMVSYLKNADSLEIYTDKWVNVLAASTPSYRFVETIYFTSSGTFTKASYPWLRAIRVKVQAGGGGGGGCTATGSAQVAIGRSGGGGAYVESFITDIAGLDDSVTVTRGAGGSGGAAGANNGTAGGVSSFGSLLNATGGNLGGGFGAFSVPVSFGSIGAQSGGTGDFKVEGSGTESAFGFNTSGAFSVRGGDSFLGVGGNSVFNAAGDAGVRGGGGSGGANSQSQGSARAGGAGGAGIVIIELYS